MCNYILVRLQYVTFVHVGVTMVNSLLMLAKISHNKIWGHKKTKKGGNLPLFSHIRLNIVWSGLNDIIVTSL